MKTAFLSSHSTLQKLLTVLLIGALLFGAVLLGIPQTAEAAYDELSPADLYEQNVGSVVGITTSGQINSRYGYGYTYQASGSGFIISDNGYILTNCHVISGSDSVTVATYDGETYDAKVIGYDEATDVAVLKIDAENLKPVTIGDSDKLRIGDPVYAIGNPMGELTFSLTHGIVSALSRDIRTGSGNSLGLIQTDCAINSGNSGGALFNERGEVVGITNAKYSSSAFSGEAEIDNICFAIPVNSVSTIVTSIVENGYVLKPYIGVTVSPLSDETAGIIGLKAGAVVQAVVEDAPADKAGIKVNDVIVKVNDTDIKDSNSLVQAIAKSKPGDVVTFEIYRQGEQIQLQVEIGSKTESALKNEEEAEKEQAENDGAVTEPEQLPQDPQEFPGFGANPFEDFFSIFGF
jgi:serine protease Do